MTQFTLLDGGMGRELQRINAPFRQPEWSALALIEAPKKVVEAHQNFIKAGADIITVNSYALVPYHIGQDLYTEQGEALTRNAVELANKAAQYSGQKSGQKTRIAACLPPIFGSYRPNAFDVGGAIGIAQTLIDAQEDGTDLWLMETMGLLAEAQLYLTLLREKGKSIWVSFSIEDQTQAAPALRSGETLADAVDAVAGEVDAVLLNCSTVEAINHAVPTLVQGCRNIQCGVYANAFPTINEDTHSNAGITELRGDITPELYAEKAAGWLDQGVNIIGGCCGIMPDHIRALSDLRA